MPDLSNLVAFAAVALGMVLTPGPNMVYLISRSICQGRTAGLGRDRGPRGPVDGAAGAASSSTTAANYP